MINELDFENSKDDYLNDWFPTYEEIEKIETDILIDKIDKEFSQLFN